MKVLTKEFMYRYRLIRLIGQLDIVSEIKGKATKEQYNYLLKERLKAFIENEKETAKYLSYNFFDKKYAEQIFSARTDFYGRILKYLPQELYDGLYDADLIKIKYCTEKDNTLLKSYYEKEVKRLEIIVASVREKNESAEWFLQKNIDFNFFAEEIIYGLKLNNNELTIDFDGCRLSIISAQIIEKEKECISNFELKNPYSEMTVLHAIELYYDKKSKKFELHLLLDNIDKFDLPNFWYLTVKCKDIKVKTL